MLFQLHDVDPEWRRRARPVGRYTSTVWIPAHLLTEGTMFVAAGVRTIDPVIRQFFEPNVVSFQVVESQNGDGARGDYGGRITGVVRPLLEWTTEYNARRSPMRRGLRKVGEHEDCRCYLGISFSQRNFRS